MRNYLIQQNVIIQFSVRIIHPEALHSYGSVNRPDNKVISYKCLLVLMYILFRCVSSFVVVSSSRTHLIVLVNTKVDVMNACILHVLVHLFIIIVYCMHAICIIDVLLMYFYALE